MADRAILWDLDGTLARREGLWTSALMQALDGCEPGHCVAWDDLRPHLRHGFPWHEPRRPHPELCAPEAWWAHVEGLMARAFAAVGHDGERAAVLAHKARFAFVDPASYDLFEDTEPVLERLRELGWRRLVLSNHVPELEQILVGLGIRERFEGIINSALTGYEKPHPKAFRLALECAGSVSEIWMVGDNPEADVAGAENVGISAILVRTEAEARHKASDLWEAAAIITGRDMREADKGD